MKVTFIFNLITENGSNRGHARKVEDVPWIESGMEICFPYSGQSFIIDSTSLMIGTKEIMAWIKNHDGTPINNYAVVETFKSNGWEVCDIGVGQGMI